MKRNHPTGHYPTLAAWLRRAREREVEMERRHRLLEGVTVVFVLCVALACFGWFIISPFLASWLR